MRRTILLLLLLAAGVMGGCASPAPNAHQFLATSPSTLFQLSWAFDTNNNFKGVWTRLTSESSNQISFTGSFQNETLTFLFPDKMVWTATVSNQQLHVQSATAGVAPTWYAVSSNEWQQLSEAFKDHSKTSQDLQTVNALLQQIPADSDPGSYDMQVISVQDQVNYQLSSWHFVQQQPKDQRCHALQQFLLIYPIHLNFQVNDPTQSTLAQRINLVQQDWNQAQKDAFPTMQQPKNWPWRMTNQQVQAGLQQPQAQYTQLQQTAKKDQGKLDQYHKAYQLIAAPVQSQRKACHM